MQTDTCEIPVCLREHQIGEQTKGIEKREGDRGMAGGDAHAKTQEKSESATPAQELAVEDRASLDKGRGLSLVFWGKELALSGSHARHCQEGALQPQATARMLLPASLGVSVSQEGRSKARSEKPVTPKP